VLSSCLKDYAPPPYLVDHVDLRVELDPQATLVHARLQLRANPAAGEPAGTLRLDGRQLELLQVALDGAVLAPPHYQFDADGLTIPVSRHSSGWRRWCASTPRRTRPWKDSTVPAGSSAPNAKPRGSARLPATRSP